LVIITHRLASVPRADHIYVLDSGRYVLDSGRITEHGTHAELMHRGARYAAMYRLQAAQFDR
jgi:ATP-binding cassette, subfamily B, bacterial